MQKKRVSGSGILDKLHRGAVVTCIGVTLYGTYLLGARAWHFFSVIKPQRELADKKMVQEGSHDKTEELKC